MISKKKNVPLTKFIYSVDSTFGYSANRLNASQVTIRCISTSVNMYVKHRLGE